LPGILQQMAFIELRRMLEKQVVHLPEPKLRCSRFCRALRFSPSASSRIPNILI
jgi:hypothetical protein